jgi:hypothetical protein
LTWPVFDRKSFAKGFGLPKEDAIEKIFWISFKQVEPYLDLDLHSHMPGLILHWDGTYGLAKKLINLPSELDCKVLLLIFGK